LRYCRRLLNRSFFGGKKLLKIGDCRTLKNTKPFKPLFKKEGNGFFLFLVEKVAE